MKLSPPRLWARALGLLFALALGSLLMSCASLVGPRQVELPVERLQASLDRKIPTDSQMLDLFSIQLLRPRLTLMPDSGRIAVALNVIVSPPFLNKSWNGGLAISGRVVLDAARGAVLLRDIRLDRMELDGVDEALQRQIAKLGSVVIDRAFENLALYTFDSSDLRIAGVQFVPTGLAIRSTSIVVTLAPAAGS